MPKKMDAGFVLDTLSDYEVTGDEPVITSVVIDSRLVQPGSLFVAFRGEQVDGHDFLGEAFEKGAILALVQQPVEVDCTFIDLGRRPYDREVRRLNWEEPLCLVVDNTLEALQELARLWRERFQDLRVIGITGSVGKTTTKELIHSVLSKKYRTLKSEGNYNNEIGLPLTLLKLNSSHERVVLEMGMYTSGEIALLSEIAQPQVGVLTIVGSVHMEWLGSIEAIASAKQELVEALPPSPEGVAILNTDDPRVMAMADQTQARVFTYGLNPEADIWADSIDSMGLEGIHFNLHYGHDRLNVRVPLLGRHSVHTSLRAAAVGLVEGLGWDEIVAGLQGLTSQLRLVAVPGPKGSIILDDTYNSSPESAVAALNLLADLDGRRIAVLGDMLELGPVEETAHRLVGRRASDVAAIIVAVGRRGSLIGQEAIQAGFSADCVQFAPDSETAARILEEMIEPADVVLVKGSRGAHLDHIVSILGRD